MPQPPVQRYPANAENIGLINKYQNLPLKEIEEIANINGHGILYIEYAPNTITVITFNPNQTICVPKSFTIDAGNIIDRRVKIIDICRHPSMGTMNMIFEYGHMYSLFNDTNNGKVLDRRLVESIFYAGTMNITKAEIYSNEWKMLNTKIDLSSRPEFKGRQAQNEFIINNLYKNGILDKCMSICNLGRFRFANNVLDDNHPLSFTLTNISPIRAQNGEYIAVPLAYGFQANTQSQGVIPITITVTDGVVKVTTMNPDGTETEVQV